MSRYIDADALKFSIAENVYPVADAFNSRDYGMFWPGGIEKIIDEQPAADVVPVVRCKDCKFRDEDAFCTGRGYPCQLVPDYGFCDKGERSEDGRA